MSSPLPKALRKSIADDSRDPVTGLVRCAHCRKLFDDKEIQIDHITPEWKGGGHDPANLQPLCVPKVGPSCHRLKSREEAAERAKIARKANRSALAWPFAVSGVGTGVVFAYFAYLLWFGKPVQPVLETLKDVGKWWIIAMLVLVAFYALAHAGIVEDVRVEEEQTPATAKRETTMSRINSAVRQEMGGEGSIVIIQEGEGYDITYHGTGFADHDDNSRLKVMKRIASKTGKRWVATWDGENDSVHIQPRPAMPKVVPHPGLPKKLAWHLLPISADVTMDLLVTPHILLIGETMSGKTSTLRSMIIAGSNAARTEQAELILMDPKRIELIGFRGWPGILRVLTQNEELYNEPQRLVAEMNERHRLFEEEKVPLTAHKPIIVIVDEYKELVKRMVVYAASIGIKTPAGQLVAPIDSISTLAAMARRCRIHLIISTQRPDAKWFGGDARDNLPGRIGVGPLSPTAARMVFERGDQGRDIPLEAKGRATVQMNDGEFIETQTYWVPDPSDSDEKNTKEDWELLARLGMPL